MKRTLSILGLALLFAGCASMSNVGVIQTLPSAAVVSVASNSTLYFVGEEPPQASLLDAALNVNANSGGDNGLASVALGRTELLLKKASEQLTAALGKVKAPQIAVGDEVINSPAYADISANDATNLIQIMAPGYKFVPNGKYVSLVGGLGKDALITVNFVFQKKMRFGFLGNGTLESHVTMSVQFFDTTGALMFTQSYTGKSTGETGVTLGAFDGEKFFALTDEAITQAIDLFVKDFTTQM